ncbi:MAG: hypothetical protein ACI83B_000626 [Sediminicola sp.]|jgi:hypothetical protein
MKNEFIKFGAMRQNQLDLLNELTLDQINKIPEGFSNNIIWNIGHNLVVQQLLTYRLSNLQIRVSEELVEMFKKDSKPERPITNEEFDMVKALLIDSVTWVEEDYNTGLFKDYQTYTTSLNVTLNSTAEAISFNTIHEAMHFGCALAIKYFV